MKHNMDTNLEAYKLIMSRNFFAYNNFLMKIELGTK